MNRTHVILEEITEENLSALTGMLLKLWPGSDWHEEYEHCRRIRNAPDKGIFVAKLGDAWVGFIQLSLRTDYVEGTSTTPVAYIEGLYVEPAFRKQHIAQSLVKKAEAWGQSKNCTEIASDTEIANTGSIAFHRALGFTEANRVVCFVKPLVRP